MQQSNEKKKKKKKRRRRRRRKGRRRIVSKHPPEYSLCVCVYLCVQFVKESSRPQSLAYVEKMVVLHRLQCIGIWVWCLAWKQAPMFRGANHCSGTKRKQMRW